MLGLEKETQTMSMGMALNGMAIELIGGAQVLMNQNGETKNGALGGMSVAR